jgi:branched-chain amino acid transport system permease protein
MTQTTRTLSIGAITVIVAALLPFGLSNYQVGLATEVLIFGILAMSIDIGRYAEHRLAMARSSAYRPMW